MNVNAGKIPLSHKTAIVITHGVQPHPRYEIQDQCAQQLCRELKATSRFGYTDWVVDVVQPQVPPGSTPMPTISRVHRAGDVDGVRAPFFDVVEAYWSPLDKGLSNFKSIMLWLVQALLVPLNTTARYASPPGKTIYELLFLFTAAIVAVALVLTSAVAALITANLIVALQKCAPGASCHAQSLAELLGGFYTGTPQKLVQTWASNFTGLSILLLIATAVGAYLLAQSAKALYGWASQILKAAPAQGLSRIVLILVVGAIALAILIVAANRSPEGGQPLGWVAIGFVFSAACFSGGRAIMQSFIVNFFSDVQVYTTHDENNTFFKARTAVLDLVTSVLVRTCSKTACAGSPYDRVFLFGHSLGSTVCMDAIIDFYQACEQEAQEWGDFYRLRGLVTFGTSLEKTKYFFDVQDPSPSASLEQWRNDAYGALFTPAVTDLDILNRAIDTGIFWANYWYFLDPICSPIKSYCSFLMPGDAVRDATAIRSEIAQALSTGQEALPNLVCRNEPRWHWFVLPSIIPHGEYLNDQHFWETRDTALGVLDIIARTVSLPAVAPVGPLPPFTVPDRQGHGGPHVGLLMTDSEDGPGGGSPPEQPASPRSRSESGSLFPESERKQNRADVPVSKRYTVASRMQSLQFVDKIAADTTDVKKP